MVTPRKKPEDYLKTGAPSTYTPELGERICNLLSTHTVGLSVIVKMYPDLPHEGTIREWRFMYPEFGTNYAKAKLYQAELLAEECLEIADNGRNDYMEALSKEENCDGWKANGENVNRSRLRVDTRKWFASKLLPKKYGDYAAVLEEGKNIFVHKESVKRMEELDEKNKKDY